jgi:hypothetical protein
VANASTIREDYRIASIPDSPECSAIKETKAIPSSKTEQPTNAGKASERIVVAATWTRSGPEIEEGFVVLQSWKSSRQTDRNQRFDFLPVFDERLGLVIAN